MTWDTILILILNLTGRQNNKCMGHLDRGWRRGGASVPGGLLSLEKVAKSGPTSSVLWLLQADMAKKKGGGCPIIISTQKGGLS